MFHENHTLGCVRALVGAGEVVLGDKVHPDPRGK